MGECGGCIKHGRITVIHYASGATKRIRARVAPDLTIEQSERRLRVCAGCDRHAVTEHGRGTATSKCAECECPTSQSDDARGRVFLRVGGNEYRVRPTGKTRLSSERCPLGKWEGLE